MAVVPPLSVAVLASVLAGITLLAPTRAAPDRMGVASSRGPAAAVDAAPAAAAPRALVRSDPGGTRAGPLAVAPGPAQATARARWVWPVPAPARVLARFRVGPQRWSPGHRGVDLAQTAGAPVRAAGAGDVTFAGIVAGRGVVVVAHAGGLRTTYEPVTATAATGQRVAAGDRIGVLQAVGWHCAPASCLHWGALRGQTYLDPLSLLQRRGPPILLPLPG